METFYLVDYENVGSAGVSKCAGLTKTDHLIIFYTENSKKIDLDIVDNHGAAIFETQKVPAKSQSVDMHIVSYMGYLVGKNEGKSIKIIIISKDKDYDNLITYWKDKVSVERKQKIEIATAKIEQTQKKTEKNKTVSTAKSSANNGKKTQLNSEIQKILSKNGYTQEAINGIAKLVGKKFGKENFKRDVHNELGKEYTDFEETYKLIKPILEKYS